MSQTNVSAAFLAAEPPFVVGLGEVLWDVFPEGKKLGGAPVNFAFHATRAGFRGLAISAIGDDALGAEIERILAEKKLSFFMPRVPAPTGTVSVRVDSAGVARYQFAENCAWDHLAFSPEMEAFARRTAAVSFGTLAQRSERSRETIRRFLSAVPAEAIRVFDVNFRQNFFSREIVLDSLAQCSVLKINADEAPIVAEMVGVSADVGGVPGVFSKAPAEVSGEHFSRALFKKFSALKIVITTLGAQGSLVETREGETSFVPADESVRVVDTVGAGDAFAAGFVCALLGGECVPAAHRRASALSAFVCSRAGAMPEN